MKLAVATLITTLASTTLASYSGFKIQNPFNSEQQERNGVSSKGGDSKPVPGESPIQVCDLQESSLLEIKHVNLDPNPPARGTNLTIEAAGTIKERIEEGAYVELDVRYGYIRLVHQTVDLCEQIQEVDMKCPLEAGDQVIKKVVQLPNEIPPGRYIVNARAYTVDDREITCLSATVDFPYAL